MGVLRLGGQRALLFDAVALGILRRELIQLLGLSGARGVLTRFGWYHRVDAQRGALMALTVTGAGGLALLGGVVILGRIRTPLHQRFNPDLPGYQVT